MNDKPSIEMINGKLAIRCIACKEIIYIGDNHQCMDNLEAKDGTRFKMSIKVITKFTGPEKKTPSVKFDIKQVND